MLAKLTAKNQLTLPKAAVQAVGDVQYFDVEVDEGRIVLTPVRIQRGDAVRGKLAALGLSEADIADAVRWARSGVAPTAAEAAARSGTAGRAKASVPARKSTKRR